MDDLPDLPLNSKWSLYFHEAFNNDWGKDSYKLVYTISTVKEFWRLINNLPKFQIYFLFFMRESHSPIWESKENDGSGWIYKIPKKNDYTRFNLTSSADNQVQPYGFTLFVDLLLYVIGETICDNPERIIGISISPKKEETTIRIWDTETSKPLVFCDKFDIDDIKNNKSVYRNKHGG